VHLLSLARDSARVDRLMASAFAAPVRLLTMTLTSVNRVVNYRSTVGHSSKKR